MQRARGDHAVGMVLLGMRTGAFFTLVAMGVLALVQNHGCVATRVVAVAFLVSGSAASLGPGIWFLFRRRFLGAFAFFAGAFVFLVVVPALTYSAFSDPACHVLQWHRDFNAPR